MDFSCIHCWCWCCCCCATLPPFVGCVWIFSLFSVSRTRSLVSFQQTRNELEFPFFAFSWTNDGPITCAVHTRSNSILRFIRERNKTTKYAIQWDFFAFLLATEKKKMNQKKNFFFSTDSAHTCLCNDVSNSNTMEIYFFLRGVRAFVWIFPPTGTHRHTPAQRRRRHNRTVLLLRNPIRLMGDSTYASQWFRMEFEVTAIREVPPTSCQTRSSCTQIACHFIYCVFVRSRNKEIRIL